MTKGKRTVGGCLGDVKPGVSQLRFRYMRIGQERGVGQRRLGREQDKHP